ncbi:endolytic transglycosylase MltG [Streptomyces noursei]|uniref:endolytic transglycosylase MltG n=1 Tax=Streptomyces noursei TaxID=1971 RepID=UPI00081CAC87|nr:putative aminodeoxychorismate lyase [Streptomyces noursei ATCC 11455]MCZ0996218.1 endolytic transglycosylase MltG [Streptomyces noursei]
MTEYGRGYGSEPWHPDDPLYGDRGPYGSQDQQPQWAGQQPAGYPHQQYPHEQHPQHPHPQHQQQHPQQYPAGHGGWDGTQQPGGQGSYDPYDPYGQHPQPDPYLQPGQDYRAPQHTGQHYAGQEYAGQEYYAGQDGYPLDGTQQIPAQPPAPQHGMPEQAPADPHRQPYGQAPHPQRPADYPPDPGPQQHPQAGPHHDEPGAGDDWRAAPDADGLEPRAPERDHPFFADDPDAEDEGYDDEDDRQSGRDRRGRKNKNKKNKRRSGTACLVVTLALAGVVGGVGYFGYDFFMRHFGSSPDYEGEGTGEVQVQIPDGVLLSEMGTILARDGVIKSAGAFTEAAGDNKKAQSLQPGTYTLRKQMSAAAAIDLMLDPKSRNGLTIREGLRSSAVYELIDKKLKLKTGTTKEIAHSQAKNLGLPSWADDSPKIKDPLEGFLYPSTYSVGDHAKPADVLRQMISRANQEYQKYDLETNAKKFHLDSPLQLITVASLTQAEGMTHDDFRKMAAVVYNRLAPTNTATNQKLEFDSTFNYLKNQSKINIGTKEIRNFDDPYNTYFYRGLPPGPIGNPGADALKATINPDDSEKWLYFISVDGKKTDFTTNYADHSKLVQEFNKRQQEQKQNGN